MAQASKKTPQVHHEGEMPLDHVSTFLRSALVRDPTKFLGLIEPEDVLKLEEEYPALFDKPSKQSSAVCTSQDENDNDPEEKVPRKPVAELAPIPEVRKKIGRPPPMRRSVPASLAGPRKPVVSQFHRKCLETTKPAMGIEKPVRMRASPRKPVEVRLARPAQSFSMEDLRETLKQVVRKDPQKFVKKSGDQESPYTEDLVRMFLGRKLEELKNSQKKHDRPLKGSQSQSHSRGHGQGHDPKGRIQMKPQQVRSAPGFLRGITDLPSAPALRKKVPHSRYTSTNKLSSRKIEMGPEHDKQDSGKHVKWTDGTKREDEQEVDDEDLSPIPSSYSKTNRPRHVSSMGYGSSRQLTETDEENELSRDLDPEVKFMDMRSASVSSSGSPRRKDGGGQIFLRSLKTGPVEPETYLQTTGPSFVRDERFPISSFRRLAARSESGKWEAQARLRKEETQTNFSTKEREREMRSPKRRTMHDSIPTRRFKFPCARKEKTYIDPDAVKLKTSRALEKIAEELVYTEILHQLREIKQEKEAKAKNQNAQTQTGTQTSKNKMRKSKTEVLVSVPLSVPPSPSPDSKSEGSFQECKSTTDYESKSRRGSDKSGPGPKSKSSSPKNVHRTPPSSKETTPRSLPKGSPSPLASAKMSHNSPRKSPSLLASASPSQEQPQIPFPDNSKSQSERSSQLKSSYKSLSSKKTNSQSQRSVSAKGKTGEEQRLQHQNLETDCSEMSDFVISEPTNKSQKKSKSENLIVPIPDPAPEESFKMDTPRLSQSFPIEKPESLNLELKKPVPEPSELFDLLSHKISNCLRISRAISRNETENEASVSAARQSKSKSPRISVNPETPRLSKSYHSPQAEPENDDKDLDQHSSTLSGVSTFNESVAKSKSQKSSSNAATDKSDRILSKYSDDFLEENDSHALTHSGPVKSESKTSHLSPEPALDSEVESDNDNNLDNLNTSGETVIDLLSEGEFIIPPTYLSPGEVKVNNVRRNLLKQFSLAESNTISEGQRVSRSAMTTSASVTRSAGRITSASANPEKAVPVEGRSASESISGESEISHISTGVQIINNGGRRRLQRDVSISLGEVPLP